MPESFSIDLDAERVLLDGVWYGREALVQRIKAMVAEGDFKLGRPSGALEALESAMSDLTTVTIKLPRGALNALTGAANRSGKSVEALARELIGKAIAAPTPSSITASSPALPTPNSPPAVTPIQLTSPVKAPTSSGADGVAPIPLTKKATDTAIPAAGGEAEQSWFNRR